MGHHLGYCPGYMGTRWFQRVSKRKAMREEKLAELKPSADADVMLGPRWISRTRRRKVFYDVEYLYRNDYDTILVTAGCASNDSQLDSGDGNGQNRRFYSDCSFYNIDPPLDSAAVPASVDFLFTSFNSLSGSSSTSSFTQESSSDLDGSGLDGSEYFSQATEDVELWVAGQVATTMASLMSLQDELDIEMEMFFILGSDSESEFDWEENSGDADDEGSETDMMEWETMDYKGLSSSDAAEAQLSAMYAHCYTIPRKINKKPPPQLPFILHHSKHHQPKQFHQCLGVSPYTFDCLVTRIQDSRVFTNNSRNAQMSVEDQLAITLYRFGHYGNAAGLDEVGRWAGVGKETVLLVTKRVLAAVLAPDMITENLRMPTEEEKEQAKRWVESCSCPAWRDGWCLVDDRSLPNLRIIDVGYGYTGSTHDATAWEKTQLKQAIDILLVVTPFKRPEKDLPQNEVFNNYVSMVHIKSEHAIGFLKGRFPSLKDLRISITDEQSHKLATYWGLGCVVTHNFAMSCEERERIAEGDFTDNAVMSDPFLIEGLEEDELDNYISGEVDGDVRESRSTREQCLSKGRRKREDLKQALFDWKDLLGQARPQRYLREYGVT
ncbi:hypothetical protein D9758_013757 [Tetrapyrgos nigripes]|uniref:DDE Tnp4 domain-containing protein n=1 Tax=Tetrapyrgos nigripes TaxID=182062 RepID=A0A8H5G1Q6_9AGAR|nr:hypothetical protein D9758_013757 [Tetrapyrgos nigripes]